MISDQTRRVEDCDLGSLLTAQIGHVGKDPMGGKQKGARTPPKDKSTAAERRAHSRGMGAWDAQLSVEY